MAYRVLTLSPGSTSTKVAVFDGDKALFRVNVTHDLDKLKSFENISDQMPYRKETIMEELNKNDIALDSMDAFSALSGGLEPMDGGIYAVNDMVLKHSREGRTVKHPAILGAQLIHSFSEETGKPAYLVNPPDVDEFIDLARLTGVKGLYRESRLHVLNQKEVAMRFAEELGKDYTDCNFVVAHVGGGLSVSAHQKGKMVDGNDVLNGDGPMSPNRSGSVPAVPIIKMCFSGDYTEKEMIAKISKVGGVRGLLGTDSILDIKKRIADGDSYAKLVYDGMAYHLSKFVGSYAVVLGGKVDGIILTGGVSNDHYFVNEIEKRCGWIAPIKAYGGEFEMEALASGAIRALSGNEALKEYTGVPIWDGFNEGE